MMILVVEIRRLSRWSLFNRSSGVFSTGVQEIRRIKLLELLISWSPVEKISCTRSLLMICTITDAPRRSDRSSAGER
jgi:hypothetical protein